MKKKGFTLVELLAVIVILAIIAIIATPIILNVIETARKNAAKSSALGYIDAVEKQIMVNDLNSKITKDGNYLVSELSVNYKGKGPTNGIVEIEKKKIKSAKLCFDKNSFEYDREKLKETNSNYCSNDFKIVLNINGTKQEESIGTSTSKTYDLSTIGVNTSEITNVSCNNGATLRVDNNNLIIENIFGDTTCQINKSLEDTINNLDSTETNIVMINDTTLSNTLTIKENNNVVMDLNGKNIEYIATEDISTIDNYGKLIINDTIGTGTMKTNYRLISNYNRLVINNGNFIRDNNIEDINGGVVGTFKGKTIINGGNYTTDLTYTVFSYGEDAVTIINSGKIYSQESTSVVATRYGKVEINGGEIYSLNNYAVSATSLVGYVDINGGMIYTLTTSDVFTINNNGAGIININGTDVVIESGQYKSGLLILACGDSNFDICSSGGRVINNKAGGVINVYGGTIKGRKNAIRNASTGTINIYDGYFESTSPAQVEPTIINVSTGIINILDGHFVSKVDSSIYNVSGIINICNGIVEGNEYDMYNSNENGYIYYTSSVTFKNNIFYDVNDPTHIIKNDSITCK